MMELVGFKISHSYIRLVTKPNTRLNSLVHVDNYSHDQQIRVTPPKLHIQHLEHSRKKKKIYIYIYIYIYQQHI